MTSSAENKAAGAAGIGPIDKTELRCKRRLLLEVRTAHCTLSLPLLLVSCCSRLQGAHSVLVPGEQARPFPDPAFFYNYMELTPGQREAIDGNKKRALALKRKREEEEAEAKTEIKVCEVCKGTQNLQLSILEVFEVSVCKACVNQSDEYDLINKNTALSEYLLPEDTLKFLPHKSMPNPHKKEWAAMKLFLRKIVRQKSYERWKDEDGLKAEKARRNIGKYRRELESATAAAAASSAAAKNNPAPVDEVAASTAHIVARMLGGAGDASAAKSAAVQEEALAAEAAEGEGKTRKKKRSSSVAANKKGLAAMIAAITGESAKGD